MHNGSTNDLMYLLKVDDPMSYLKKLAQETVIYGGSSILARVLNYLLLSIYLTRKLPNVAYGTHSIYYALAALLLIIYTFRFETAFFRFGNKKSERESSFSTASMFLLFMALSFSSYLVWHAEHIAQLLTIPADAKYVRWFAYITAADSLSAIPFARLRLENRPVRFAIIKSFSMLCNVLLVLFFLEVWPSWEQTTFLPTWQNSLILDYVFLANLIASIITLLLLSPQYVQMQWQFHIDLWKRMLRYSWPLLIVGIAGTVNMVFDKFLLRWLLPGEESSVIAEIGVYAACMKIAVLMNLISQAYNYAAEPFFFKEADTQDATVKYARTAQAFSFVSCIAILAIALHLDWLKYLISDDKWGALPLVPVALLGYFFLGMYYNFSVWYKVTDRTKSGAVISIIGASITILAHLLLVPIIGIWGAVIATVLCFSSLAIITVIWGRKVYPIPYAITKMLTYLLSAIGTYMLFLLLRQCHLPLALTFILPTIIWVLYLSVWVYIERKQFSFLGRLLERIK